MFEVQVVRQRGSIGTRRGLQALRRCFVMTVGDRHLKLCTSFVSPTAVLSISHNRIKSVRIRGRLLRIAVGNDDTLTVRLRDREEALQAAEAMMNTWEIDPLVENSEMPTVQSEVAMDCGVAPLVRHYMDDPNFRHLVQEIHDHIDAVIASEEVCFRACV